MKKKKMYQLLPLVMAGICVAGMCAVGVRIFAKKVIIGKLGIDNYVTCALADYDWGDRKEAIATEIIEKKSKQKCLEKFERIYYEANNLTEDTEEEENISLLNHWKTWVIETESDIEKYCNGKFMLYTELRNISFKFDQMINWNLTYARTNGTTYTLKTGFDYEAVEAKDMSDYADKIIAEANYAKKAGVDFLYVQYPYRVDEESTQVPWGADAYENDNADQVLKLLGKNSVDVLDLREALQEAGWENNTGFYETDGHWTTRSGFQSAGILADYLNTQFDFQYDAGYFDETNYKVKSYGLNNPSIREKVELFLPDFETYMVAIDAYRKEYYRGRFEETAFDLSMADTKEYSTVLTAYSASRVRNSYFFEYQNLNTTNNKKRLLVCSNSFCWHLIPYLALDTEYLDFVYNITTDQMEYYINTLSPDVVIVLDRP